MKHELSALCLAKFTGPSTAAAGVKSEQTRVVVMIIVLPRQASGHFFVHLMRCVCT